MPGILAAEFDVTGLVISGAISRGPGVARQKTSLEAELGSNKRQIGKFSTPLVPNVLPAAYFSDKLDCSLILDTQIAGR